jgi:hypothetical protein
MINQREAFLPSTLYSSINQMINEYDTHQAKGSSSIKLAGMEVLGLNKVVNTVTKATSTIRKFLR